MANGYGADLTHGQCVRLVLALMLGTVVEWYDFTVYSQLSTVLTAAFFPSSNAATAQLSFWGVFAVGFISRPLGAVIFGHIGDAHGRRITMLLSILTMTIPTVIIGALPTYRQAGLVAPVLLAAMRFIQGLAVGGEFGAAVVYLYEIAPRNRKSLLASMAEQAMAPGIMLGILACLAVMYACTKEQLELWGWRIPFLLTLLTTPVAVIMRMHMPEPYEFLESTGKMTLERSAGTSTHEVAPDSSLGAGSQGVCLELGPSKDPELIDLQMELEAEGGGQAAVKRHLPLAMLFASHWRMLLLQFLMEAGLGSGFYTFVSWTPAYLRTTGGVKPTTSLWVVMVAMLFFFLSAPLAGWLGDRGTRKMNAMMATIATIAIVALPVFMALHTGHLAAAFLLLPLMLGLTGFMGAFICAVSPLLYPADVRSSGFNLAHNLAMVVWGGCLPFMIQALSIVLKPGALAAGVLMVGIALIALAASACLARLVPATNAGKGPCCSAEDAAASVMDSASKEDAV